MEVLVLLDYSKNLRYPKMSNDNVTKIQAKWFDKLILNFRKMYIDPMRIGSNTFGRSKIVQHKIRVPSENKLGMA